MYGTCLHLILSNPFFFRVVGWTVFACFCLQRQVASLTLSPGSKIPLWASEGLRQIRRRVVRMSSRCRVENCARCDFQMVSAVDSMVLASYSNHFEPVLIAAPQRHQETLFWHQILRSFGARPLVPWRWHYRIPGHASSPPFFWEGGLKKNLESGCMFLKLWLLEFCWQKWTASSIESSTSLVSKPKW